MNALRRPRRPRVSLFVEELEPRLPPASLQPTPIEQEFLERLNDARANPAAYGVSIGLNLSHVAPAPPLAFDTRLIAAARGHSLDMAQRHYYNHVTPNGVGPFQRIHAAGFPAVTTAESITISESPTLVPVNPDERFSPLIHGAFQPEDALSSFIFDFGVPDLGHRKDLLDIDSFVKSHNLVGIGYAFRDLPAVTVKGITSGLTNYYWTVDSGYLGVPQRFLTGAVFRDLNHNGKYDVGEGVGGVTIRVTGGGKVSDWASGGYTVPVLHAGTYTVTASGGGVKAPVTRTVHVGNTNARLQFIVP
jgi:uncharacterized protein YkwD